MGSGRRRSLRFPWAWGKRSGRDGGGSMWAGRQELHAYAWAGRRHGRPDVRALAAPKKLCHCREINNVAFHIKKLLKKSSNIVVQIPLSSSSLLGLVIEKRIKTTKYMEVSSFGLEPM